MRGTRRGWPAIVVGESDLNDPRAALPATTAAATAWTPNGPTTSTTPRTPSSPASARATTSTSASRSNWPGRSRRPVRLRVGLQPVPRPQARAPPEGLSGDRFVVCLQNHDQVGNRAGATGSTRSSARRPSSGWPPGLLLLVAATCRCCSWARSTARRTRSPSSARSATRQLVEAVREGRKKEFDAFAWQGEVPDPQGEETFASARLSWSWPEGTHRAGLRRLYRDLLAARREWPALRDFEHRSAAAREGSP